jgi:hypothetical protein
MPDAVLNTTRLIESVGKVSQGTGVLRRVLGVGV